MDASLGSPQSHKLAVGFCLTAVVSQRMSSAEMEIHCQGGYIREN
jgi:hypothetical protein